MTLRTNRKTGPGFVNHTLRKKCYELGPVTDDKNKTINCYYKINEHYITQPFVNRNDEIRKKQKELEMDENGYFLRELLENE